MAFRLYNYVLSGNCYKIRLLASLLGVSYETVSVDFHPGREHKGDALLRLNPAGTLPVLVTDDGEIFTETQAMLVWLAERHDADRRWWPVHDARQIASVMQWLGFASRLSATVGELRLHTMLNKPLDAAAARKASIQVLRELESRLAEQRIHGRAWLAGDTPTIADIGCFAYTALSPHAGIEHDDYPLIRGWLHGLRLLDGFITMPGIYELHGHRNPAGRDASGGQANDQTSDQTNSGKTR